MCTIMTVTGPLTGMGDFAEAFSLIRHRGPDDTRIIRAGDGIMGFHRLAIMGLTPEGMQPFGDLDFVQYVMSIDPELKLNKYGNRSWEGCDVDDPSARVLSNYGASGI